MYLLINKCVTAVILSKFSGHYLRNRSTSDIGVLGYIGVLTEGTFSRSLAYFPWNTLYIFARNSPIRVWSTSFPKFPDHTQLHTLGNTGTDKGPAHRRDLYLTTQNIQETSHLCHRRESKPSPSKQAAADR